MRGEPTARVPLDQDRVDGQAGEDPQRVEPGEERRLLGGEDDRVGPAASEAVGVLAGEVQPVVGVLDDRHPEAPTREATHRRLEGKGLTRAAGADDLADERGRHRPRMGPGA